MKSESEIHIAAELAHAADRLRRRLMGRTATTSDGSPPSSSMRQAKLGVINWTDSVDVVWKTLRIMSRSIMAPKVSV